MSMRVVSELDVLNRATSDVLRTNGAYNSCSIAPSRSHGKYTVTSDMIFLETLCELG